MKKPDNLGTDSDAWAVLDEAQQLLLRAESVVVLLGSEPDASAHHSYAADVASELLTRAKERVSKAQEIVRRPGQPSAPGNDDRH